MELPLNQIIQGDCLDVLKTFPDKCVDLVLSDPPYGISYQSARRTATAQFEKIQNDASLEWVSPFLREAYRIMKDNTHIYLFCNDYAISDFRREVESIGFTPKRTLVWVKNNHTSGDLEGDYGNKTEFILYAQKGRRELNGKRETNVLTCSRVARMSHPTEKPTDLCTFLIRKSTSYGQVVLDPFLGSGTTAVAAKMEGRDFIGIEISEKYCDIARRRVASAMTPLFTGARLAA